MEAMNILYQSGVRMNVHTNGLEKPLIFKRGTFAQHDMAHKWILALEEASPSDTTLQRILKYLTSILTQLGV